MKYALLPLLLLLRTQAHADLVVTAGKRFVGRVTAITSQSVVFLGGCDPMRRGEIELKQVTTILFDPGLCDERPVPLPSAGMQGPCESDAVDAYEIGFASGGFVLAHGVIMTDGKVHVDLQQSGSVHGPASGVRSITAQKVCPSILSEQKPKVPAPFCLEPWHVAVNFSFVPAFNNDVFARGFTVYLASDDLPNPEVAARRRELVSRALGSAVLVWTSALQQIRKTLTGELAKWVDSIVLRGGQYQMLSPPQAVPATCPDFGSIHVRWLTADDLVFPYKRHHIAKAQVEGRTIALNSRDFDFAWNLQRAAISQQQTDLIKVLAHEFGHCLGLQHAPPGVPSLMADTLTRIPELPTESDAEALVEILGRPVRATAAGHFNATSCSGLLSGNTPVASSVLSP